MSLQDIASLGKMLAQFLALFADCFHGDFPVPHRYSNVLARRLGQRSGAPKKTHVPDDIQFLTKPQIALVLIDEAMADGITVKAWTFDELYGRDGKFLDGLDRPRREALPGAELGQVLARFGRSNTAALSHAGLAKRS